MSILCRVFCTHYYRESQYIVAWEYGTDDFVVMDVDGRVTEGTQHRALKMLCAKIGHQYKWLSRGGHADGYYYFDSV